MIYATVVLDARPDAVLTNRNMWSDRAWVDALDAESAFPVRSGSVEAWSTRFPDSSDNFGSRVVDVLQTHAEARTIYWEPIGQSSELPAGLDLAVGWPLGVVYLSDTPGGACLGPACYGRRNDPGIGLHARDEAGADHRFYRSWLAAQWSYLGASALRSGRVDVAIRMFDQGLEVYPASSALWTNIGVARAMSGDLRGALDAAQRGHELDPEREAPLQNMVLYARALGDTEAESQAVRALSRIGLSPSR